MKEIILALAFCTLCSCASLGPVLSTDPPNPEMSELERQMRNDTIQTQGLDQPQY